MQTIKETECEHVVATHGYTSQVVRYLTEKGMSATSFETRFKNEDEEQEIEETVT